MSWEKRVYAVLATHIMKQLIAKQIVNEKSLWWDILRPKNRKESRTEILSKSFKETIAALEAQLGKSVPPGLGIRYMWSSMSIRLEKWLC
jgi:hypothetical protein